MTAAEAVKVIDRTNAAPISLPAVRVGSEILRNDLRNFIMEIGLTGQAKKRGGRTRGDTWDEVRIAATRANIENRRAFGSGILPPPSAKIPRWFGERDRIGTFILPSIHCSITTAAERAGRFNVPSVGSAWGCSGVATTSGPGCGSFTSAVIGRENSMFTTTTARLPFAVSKTE